MSSLKCVVFDMDGTLTHTNQLIFDSFNHIARKYEGREYTPAEITAMFGPPEEWALVKIAGKEKLGEVMKEYLAFYRTHHNELAQLVPGIVEVLSLLKNRGVRLALFTGKGTYTTAITLELFGLVPYFEFVVTGNDVVNYKPSAEGLLKIASQFGYRPDEMLMVGDSVGDIKAAHDAGSKIAAVLWDSFSIEKVLAMKTDYVFHTVAELLAWARGEFD